MDQGGSPTDRGVNFQLRYIGSMAINASMKSLEFTVRSSLTKECITRICEATHMITERRRRVDRQILKYLPGAPNTQNSGINVYMTVSTRHIVVTLMEPQIQILFDHQLPEISFACVGDQETADFVAYVAKDERNGRHCYVFECGTGQSATVITAVSQAFNTRFHQVTSTPVTTVNVGGIHPQNQHQYPSPTGASSTPTVSSHHQSPTSPPEPPPRVTLASSPRSPALIDLEGSPPLPAVHSHVNTPGKFFTDSMSPSLPYMKNLAEQPWFHGCMSRDESESLLRQDGEFLVRARPQDPNQIILSGLQNGVHKHLMLIDEEGKVRTKDREFDSVVHLIEHHRNSLMPITSAESAILLRSPVEREP